MADEQPPRTKEELLTYLAEQVRLANPEDGSHADPEAAHYRADYALLDYINDPQIAAAYEAVYVAVSMRLLGLSASSTWGCP
jgi:hypothetical protein